MIAVFKSYKYDFINLNTDKNIIAFIGVVLSILTSALLTAITICSDITFITAQNRCWKVIWDRAKEHLNSVQYLNLLLFAYVLNLTLSIIIMFSIHNKLDNPFFAFDIFEFMTIATMFFALFLPNEVIAIQRAKLKFKIDEAKNGDN